VLRPSGTVSGGGVVAASRIRVGDIVMSCPKNSCLTIRSSALMPLLRAAPAPPPPPAAPPTARRATSRRRPAAPAVDAAALVAAAPEDVRLTLAVMLERALGPRSRWAPYLATLPAANDGVPTTWPADDAAALLQVRGGGAAAHPVEGRAVAPPLRSSGARSRRRSTEGRAIAARFRP
jgi:hypothetical protein